MNLRFLLLALAIALSSCAIATSKKTEFQRDYYFKYTSNFKYFYSFADSSDKHSIYFGDITLTNDGNSVIYLQVPIHEPYNSAMKSGGEILPGGNLIFHKKNLSTFCFEATFDEKQKPSKGVIHVRLYGDSLPRSLKFVRTLSPGDAL